MLLKLSDCTHTKWLDLTDTVGVVNLSVLQEILEYTMYNYKRIFIIESPVVRGSGRLTENIRLLCRLQKLILMGGLFLGLRKLPKTDPIWVNILLHLFRSWFEWTTSTQDTGCLQPHRRLCAASR